MAGASSVRKRGVLLSTAGKRRSLVWLLACAALPIMMTGILTPSLPGLHAAYSDHADIEILSKLALTTPALAIALSAGLIGILLDRWGRRPVLGSGLLLFSVAGTLGFWAETIYGLIGLRFVFGLGVAAIMTASATLLADFVKGDQLRQALGLQAGLMGGWGIIAQLAAGWVAEYNWRAPFALYAIALPLLLSLPAMKIPEPSAQALEEEALGASEGGSWKLSIAFLGCLAFLGMSLFSLVLVHSPFYFRHTAGIGPRGTGILISTLTAASSLSSFSLAVLRRHIRLTKILGLGFVEMALGLAVLAFIPKKYALVGGMLLIGVGIGSIMPVISAWLAQLVKTGQRGRFLGLLTTLNYLGQFSSPLWAQMLLSGHSDQGLFGIAAGLAVFAALAVFGARALLGLPAEPKKEPLPDAAAPAAPPPPLRRSS